MDTYILCRGKNVKRVIKDLLDASNSENMNFVTKMVNSGPFTNSLGEEDFSISEGDYPEKIVLPEYDYETDNKMCLKLAKILLDRVNYDEKIKLSSEEIEELLINRKNDTLNKKIFYALCDLHADMTGVDISNTYIHGIDFRGLNNLVIDLDKVKDKDLINVNFDGVTLKGSLDDCKLYYTRFGGSNNDLKLDPQKIKHKFMMNTLLKDIEVVGSFDGVKIDGCDFDNTKGKVIINPQTLPDKRLYDLNLGDCLFLDENGNPASFKGCTISCCKFNKIEDGITINLDDLEYQDEEDDFDDTIIKTKLSYCNLQGVTLTGNVLIDNLNSDLYDCYTAWTTFPNLSAPVDVFEEYYKSEWGYLCRHGIDLNNPKSYDRKDVNIQINIIDKKKEREKEIIPEKLKTENKKKIKRKKFKEFIVSQFQGR